MSPGKERPMKNLQQMASVLVLAGLLILLGLYPQPVIDSAHGSIEQIQRWYGAVAAVSQGGF